MPARRVAFIVCLWFSAWSCSVEAAQLAGTAKSTQGQTISRVKITLRAEQQPQSTFSTETGSDGRFQFRDLPLGVYRVQAAKDRWLPVEQLVTLKEQSVFEVPPELTLTLELKPLYVLLNRMQFASVIYLLAFALLILAFNLYLVSEPSRGLAVIGWSGVGLALLVSFIKHGWLDFLGLTMVGGSAAWLIHSHGSRVAARRTRQENEERCSEQAFAERQQQQLESLVGQQGIAICDLKSCGTIRVNGQDVPARATHGFVPTNTSVIVTRMEGTTAIVDCVEPVSLNP